MGDGQGCWDSRQQEIGSVPLPDRTLGVTVGIAESWLQHVVRTGGMSGTGSDIGEARGEIGKTKGEHETSGGDKGILSSRRECPLGVATIARGNSKVVKLSGGTGPNVSISSAIDGRKGNQLGWGVIGVSSDSS